MKKPKVSIVIPVYNGSNYMIEAIDSALAQDYENLEIIVVNDGSTDDGKTHEIALSYGDKIRYFEKENGGVSTALNLGIEKMTGDFFSWLSHDDRYYKNKIKCQIDYLIKNKLLNEKVITYTNYDVIDENSIVTNDTKFEIYEPNKNPELALLRGLVSGTSLLIPKEAFKEHGVFDIKYRCIQDYLLFFKFMKNYKYIHIPKVTNSTRVHSAQVTNCNPKVIEENNYLWTYMQKNITDETKIRINNSLYDFYLSMEDYLKNEITFDYKEARMYALNKSNECHEKGKSKIIKLIEKYGDEKIYYYLSYFYNNYKKVVRINDKKYIRNLNISQDKTLKSELLKVNQTISLYNSINILYQTTKIKKMKSYLYFMMYSLSKTYNYYPKLKINLLDKLRYISAVKGKLYIIILFLKLLKNRIKKNIYFLTHNFELLTSKILNYRKVSIDLKKESNKKKKKRYFN